MSRKALLIGINYIGTDSALNGCINDVLNIKRFLIENFELPEKNIVLLTEASGLPELLPTKANIIRNIHWLVEGATSESKLFIHYSGHGTYIKDTSGDENDGRDECLCPLDYQKSGLIKDDTLKRILVDPLPKYCQLFGIFDCCHSGTVLDLRFNYLFHANKRNQEYVMTLEKNAKATEASVVILSGCLDNQTSADYFESSTNQYSGALTFSFLRAYERLSANNKKVNCMNLMRLLYTYIKKGRFTQNPKISTGKLTNLDSKITIL